MNCCQRQGYEVEFNRYVAAKDLQHYRTKGPNTTTRLLIDALKTEGVKGMTLLDIGGGVGVIQHELLQVGVRRAINVEASMTYLDAAKEEATRQGHADRISFHQGDFVDICSDIPPADIVTLDRVLCCYPDVQQLVRLSAVEARHLYGIVYPRDTWWVKVLIHLQNVVYWVQRKSFRVYVHPTEVVETIVYNNGLKRRFSRETMLWQMVVYMR